MAFSNLRTLVPARLRVMPNREGAVSAFIKE
jgi:hypothetical protein